MTERDREILKAVVQIHINTGEPVGSRTIAKHLNMKLSPATIRNIMADLEESGFLIQPHTSAGRVPTDLGYRYYVDNLIEEKSVEEELNEFDNVMRDAINKAKDIKDVLKAASKFLSERTRQVGLLFIPKIKVLKVKNVEFIKVANNTILVIFASESGIIQHKLVQLEEDYTQEQLNKFSNYINQRFSGKNLAEIRKELLSEMERDKAKYDEFYNKALELSKKAMSSIEQEEFEVHFEGTSHILEHKEFIENVEKLREIFKAFEEKSKIVKILDQCLSEDSPTVIIGMESGFEDFKELALITTSCSFKDRIFGTLGVVSPKRVDYAFLIPLVQKTAEYIEEILD
ncbi:heat-inducible transcriptional repressor [Thermosulfidibacter takaii ABI70S6]|uniref:Heat-inducible transcription repressor HrcA n=1 Tax=Thermosulfidibacter takaii (strain DSM 17441 / JCM 13301 / NBRC 103674 / ABI70S6) TaxID=1298851 RepID=A0A0S3QUA0_THET7|nr:heat-inducible transcriptional repressor HrcA [Thermosulfidibacter takaii]BAT71913.1 heat-inducible transcriptional repressor [Thermosulfidibacter takaii ABI70S6]